MRFNILIRHYIWLEKPNCQEDVNRKLEWKLLKVDAEWFKKKKRKKAVPPPQLVSAVWMSPSLLLYKFRPCKCVRSHTASATSPTAALRHWACSGFWNYWVEMSDSVKPLTSFLIEDILSNKDNVRFNDKCSLQKAERCSQWNEESEKFSPQLCLQDTAFGLQAGERLQVCTSRIAVGR